MGKDWTMWSLELRILGGFEGWLKSGSAIELPTKKTELLLCFLALFPGTSQPRTKLASLLWSDRGDEQAHHSLRHSLSALRKAFAELEISPLIADRESVSLDPEAVKVDAVEFQSLVAAATPEALEQACTLYCGDLLSGVRVGDPCFEEWLFYERQRLRDLALQAFEKLLAHQQNSGETAQAIETAQRLLLLSPAHEETHRVLMRLFAGQGRRAAALEQYKHCRSALQHDLDVEPGPETEQLYQEILHRQEQPVRRISLPGIRSPSRPWVTAAAATVIVVLAGGVLWLKPWGPDVAPASVERMAYPLPDKPSIAVLPFKNLSDNTGNDHFIDGLTESVITELSRYPDLFVIASNSVFTYKGRPVKVQEVAEELGVRHVLEGSAQQSGNQVRVNAQLIDAVTGYHLWAQRYEGDLSDVFTLQDEIALQIVGTLATAYGGRLTKAWRDLSERKGEVNFTAYDYILRGESLFGEMTRESILEARRLFEKAIEIDPSYARAHAKLAWTYIQAVYDGWAESPKAAAERARELASTAVRLDETDPWGHWALGGALSNVFMDYDKGLEGYERALELSPNDADILADYGWLLALAGHPEDGIEQINRAMRLNPYYPSWYMLGLGLSYYGAGMYEKAIAALERGPLDNPTLRLYLAASHGQLGHEEEAREALVALLGAEPDLSIERLRPSAPYKDSKDFEHFLDGLRKAGLQV